MNDNKIRSCDGCEFEGAAECPADCPPGFETDRQDWRDCKVCGKKHNPAKIRQSFGDVWWLGLFCSVTCLKHNQEKGEDDVDIIKARYFDLRRKMTKDFESGRIPTRWDGIESKIDLALSLVEDEAKVKALARGLFTSPHEGYGIIAEEVAELLDAIRSNQVSHILAEAIQVAAAGLVLAATIVIWEGVPEQTLQDMKENDDVEAIRDMLILCDIHIPETVIEEWTPEERAEVENFAGAVHLAASDNDVEVPETPECLSKVLIKPKEDRKVRPQ